jgi:hypothetical protein
MESIFSSESISNVSYFSNVSYSLFITDATFGFKEC